MEPNIKPMSFIEWLKMQEAMVVGCPLPKGVTVWGAGCKPKKKSKKHG